MIDRLFDVMNSRNPCAKGFKAPLSSLNWTKSLELLLRGRAYLLSLLLMEHLFIVQRGLLNCDASIIHNLFAVCCFVSVEIPLCAVFFSSYICQTKSGKWKRPFTTFNKQNDLVLFGGILVSQDHIDNHIGPHSRTQLRRI